MDKKQQQKVKELLSRINELSRRIAVLIVDEAVPLSPREQLVFDETTAEIERLQESLLAASRRRPGMQGSRAPFHAGVGKAPGGD